jgi:hypothetical protein
LAEVLFSGLGPLAAFASIGRAHRIGVKARKVEVGWRPEVGLVKLVNAEDRRARNRPT